MYIPEDYEFTLSEKDYEWFMNFNIYEYIDNNLKNNYKTEYFTQLKEKINSTPDNYSPLKMCIYNEYGVVFENIFKPIFNINNKLCHISYLIAKRDPEIDNIFKDVYIEYFSQEKFICEYKKSGPLDFGRLLIKQWIE